MALLLQVSNDFFLTFRQHTGNDPGDLHPFLDGFRRPLVIPGQHDNIDAQLFKFGNSLSAGFLFPVCYGDQAQQFLLPGKQQRRFSFVSQTSQLISCRGNVDARLFHQPVIPCVKTAAVFFRLHAFSKKRRKVFHFGNGNLFLRNIFHHGAGQRVAAAVLQPCRRCK